MSPKQWLIHNLILQPSSNMTFNVIEEGKKLFWKCIWLKQFLNPFKLVIDTILGNDRGVWVGGDSDEKWAGSDGQGLGLQGWGSDGQGVQVRWARGSGQMGRGFRSVRQGRDGLGGWVPGVGRYLTPLFFITVPQTPGAHPLCPSPRCLQLTYTGLKNCFNQIHFQIDLNVYW